MGALLKLGRIGVGWVRVLAELKRADVGDDRPSVLRFDSRSVAIHRAVAVGDDIVKVSYRHLAEPVGVVVAGRTSKGESALRDHSITVAKLAVTGSAIDPEAILTALEQVRRNRHRKLIDPVATLYASKERGVLT